MPCVSIPQDLFHPFYPNLPPATLWHTLSLPVSGIFRFLFVHSKQNMETNQDFVLKERCTCEYEYMLYTPKEQTDLAGGESLSLEFLWGLRRTGNWGINS